MIPDAHRGSVSGASASVICARVAACLGSLLLAGCQTRAEPPPSLHVVVTDAGHESPDSVMAGLRHLRFENRGSTIHEALVIRLPDGMTAAQYSAAVAGGSDFPEGAIDCSGPGLTSPGESLDVWVDLEPGRYILTCWFRHPAPDGSYNNHVALAPPREFVVVPTVQNDPAPEEDAMIRLVDYRYQLEGVIKPGRRTLRVEMRGPSMHEMDMYRLDAGRSLDDLKAWHLQGRKTPPPGEALGGALDSHAVPRTVWMRREFTPGRYVTWCGMDMPAQPGAKPATHADAGMIAEFTVAER